MNHLAILKQPLLNKILNGEKTIESRWYKTRRTPWNRAHTGDTIYLKESGGAIKAKATAHHVEQFADLTREHITRILNEHPGISVDDQQAFMKRYGDKTYGVLIHLTDVTPIEDFAIDKTGYGNQAAWITVEDIEQLRAP